MKILPQIIACIVFGTILGVVFWLCDGGKTCPWAPKCPGVEIERAELDFKVCPGEWVEDIKKIGDFWSVGYLEVIK